MKRFSRSMLAFLFLLTMLLSFSGCIRVEYKATVHMNGTVDFSLTYAVQSSSEELLGEDFDTEKSEQALREALASNGCDAKDISVKTYKDGEYVGFVMNVEKLSVKDGLEGDGSLLPSIPTSGIQNDGMVCSVHIPLGNAGSGEEMTDSVIEAVKEAGGYYRYVIQLPVAAKESNATETSPDGKTLTWDAFSVDELYFSFSRMDLYLPWIIGGILFLVVAAAVIVLLILFKKKKNKIIIDGGFEENPVSGEAPDGIEEIQEDAHSGETKETTEDNQV